MITLAKNNPRTIDKKSSSFNELVESIAAQGVIVPVHVRSDPSHKNAYELLAGERRYWAARKAALKTIPAIDHGGISDEEAFEITFAENFQREDLTTLEHGRAVAVLLEKYKADFAAVAARIGRSETWVRMHHCIEANLADEWKKAISPGGEYEKLTAAHMGLIARFPAETQLQIYRQMKRSYMRDVQLTVKGLEREVAALLRLLSKAPFDPAGCEQCMKRSSVQPSLWLDDSARAIGKDDRCLDPHCWAAKEIAAEKQKVGELRKKRPGLIAVSTFFIYSGSDEAKAAKAIYGTYLQPHEYKSCKKSDKGAVPAVMVDGEARGKIHYVKVTKHSPSKPKTETAKEKQASVEKQRWSIAVSSLMRRISDATYEQIHESHAIVWLAAVFGAADCYGAERRAIIEAFKNNSTDFRPAGEAIWQDIRETLRGFADNCDGVADDIAVAGFVAAVFGCDLQAEYDAVRICRECGCTDSKTCPDDGTGKPCHWAEEDLCSACKAKAEPAAKKTKGRNGKSKKAGSRIRR